MGFHHGLDWAKNHIVGGLSSLEDIKNHWASPWLFFLVPTVGGLLSGLLVYSLAPETEGHGTDAMIDNFHNKGGKVRTRVPFVKAITSILTIATGGSAGYEGPTAQIGAGIGSILSRAARIPLKMRRLLLLSGTAAGLGAIFRAPLGGALTSVEVIYKEDFESEGFLPCIVASVVAYATFTQITHAAGAIFKIPEMAFTNPSELILFGILGVVCAPVSKIFVEVFYFCVNHFKKLNIKPHFKPAIGGLGVGLIAYICPQAIGGGWMHLESAINGEFAISVLIMIAGFKIVTTSLTVGSGGSGGVFGPSLFIGGMLGAAYGYGMEAIFPEAITNPSAYVLVGMGAFFAGIANAPIASIIMVCEITGNYKLLAPLMFASIIHLTLSRKWSIYKNQLLNKFESPVHKEDLNTDVLQSIAVSSILDPESKIEFVHINDSIYDIKKFLEETEVDVFPVLSQEEKLVGLLGMNQLRKVVLQTSTYNLVIVEDMMTPLYTLAPELDLHQASQIFLRSNQIELPVVDENQQVLGMLKYQDIIQAYDNVAGKPR